MIIGIQNYNLGVNQLTRKNLQPRVTTPVTRSYTPTFTGDLDTFDFDEAYKKNLKEYGWWSRNVGSGKEKARKTTLDQLTGFNQSRNRLIEEKNQTIKAKEEALQAQREALEISKEYTAKLEKQLEDAKKNNVTEETVLSLQEQVENLTKQNLATQEQINSESSRISKMKTDHEILTTRSKEKGWGSLGGYEEIKNVLDENFINKIALEMNGEKVDFPNGILFYGPKSTGKTHITQALADQANCEIVEIDMLLDDDELFDDIKNAARKAKKRFDNEGRRTFILLDEFDGIAHLSDEEAKSIKAGTGLFEDTNIGVLKEFMETCANKYKCTVLMTSNHPLDIDHALFDNKIIPLSIFMGAPDAKDAGEIFRFHLEDFTKQPINYQELGELVDSARENNIAFSAGKITNIAETCKNLATRTGQQITHKFVVDVIKQASPDIDSATLAKFTKEILEVGRRLV